MESTKLWLFLLFLSEPSARWSYPNTAIICFEIVILKQRLPVRTVTNLFLFCSCTIQLIQTVSAVDQDDPQEGQHFYYSLAPEAANNPNFTLRDNQGNQSGHSQLVTVISPAQVGLERF